MAGSLHGSLGSKARRKNVIIIEVENINLALRLKVGLNWLGSGACGINYTDKATQQASRLHMESKLRQMFAHTLDQATLPICPCPASYTGFCNCSTQLSKICEPLLQRHHSD